MVIILRIVIVNEWQKCFSEHNSLHPKLRFILRSGKRLNLQEIFTNETFFLIREEVDIWKIIEENIESVSHTF